MLPVLEALNLVLLYRMVPVGSKTDGHRWNGVVICPFCEVILYELYTDIMKKGCLIFDCHIFLI